ncbi:facilitated trehalose transporter Tret1-like [Belonocnema kinseyi]|uniref:facilitated trehalose transporter Tret1-like n=1 Tax=Belonocnema kinseyi TaxID=2817044 RepID=UPI00143D245D|nr:facilitated trehalose transporter Tret1-like [Belonocnema kinseyi]
MGKKTNIFIFGTYNCTCIRNSRNYSSTITVINMKEDAGGKPQRRKAYFFQFMSILPGYILMIDVGAVSAWPSPALPYLISEKSEFPVSVEESSWLPSVINISALFGSIPVPMLINRIGRKYTLLVLGLLQLISWILVNLSYNYTILLIARLYAGFCIGGTFGMLPIYIGEISEKNIRGSFLSLDKIFMNGGVFVINALGAYLTYKNMNLIMMSVPMTAICMFPLISETPYFYLLKGRDEEAINTLMKLSGVKNQEMVMEDIKRMKEAIIESRKSKNSSLREIFIDKGSRRAVIIISITKIIYVFTGQVAIQSYTQEIFSYSGSSITPGHAAMILTGVQIFAGLPAFRLSDKWGRKPIYLFSGFTTALGLGIVGLFFFLKLFLKYDVSNITWMPLVFLVLTQFSCNVGLSTMPFIYSGELLSVKVKGVATILTSIVGTLSSFSVKMLLPFLNMTVGIYTSFFVFSGACIIGPIILVSIVPETKGKNLEEVSKLFKHSKRNNCFLAEQAQHICPQSGSKIALYCTATPDT